MNDIANPSAPFDVGETVNRARAAWSAGRAAEAEMLCRQVLSVWPGQTDAAYLLGLMAYTYGNLDLAVTHLREACQAPRAPAVYFSDFAEMLRRKGLLIEAEQAARRAIALAPEFPAAWNNLGIVLQEALKLDESRVCLERALSLEGDSAQTLNNLANTLKRMGHATEAEKCWKRSLTLKPDYPEAYSNLANLLLDQGEYEQAEASARRALALAPRLADAYVNLAATYSARREHLDALTIIDELLAFAPEHPRALAARALSLKEIDRFDEALEAAKRAVLAAPESPEAHNALGQVRQGMGEFEAALAAYDRAAALPGPAQQDAIANRGSLFMEFGRKDEALRAMEEAAIAFPNSPGVLFNQTTLKRFKAGDPLIGQMLTLLGRDGWTLTDRATLQFALGKAFFDIGDSEAAFRHYNEGNRLKRTTFTYDPGANERWMASIAEAFTPALLAAKASAGTRSCLPVFIVGMPRSGTTLIEQILGSHPMVATAGELKWLQRLTEALPNYPACVAELTNTELTRLGEAYLGFVAPLAAGKPLVIDKMPSNFLACGMIRLILPEARIIHSRRDPVDTCLSCYTMLFSGEQPFTYDQIELARFHRAYQALMAHWRAILPATHFLEVDYELMVDDMEGQTRRILDFLGLAWDERVLKFYELQRPVRTASVNQVREPIYRASVGRWKTHAAQIGPLLDALTGPNGSNAVA